MQIRRLEIENFRGISALTWHPGPGINVLLGPGDAGKSSILDAIALALSPQPAQAALETDYRNLDTSTPFRVGLVVGHLSEEVQARAFPPPFWGWDAGQHTLLDAPDEARDREAVLKLEVTGSPDLELVHSVLQPGNERRTLSLAMRLAIGLWNVSTNRTPDAQLRMSRGSLLERAVGREHMRAPAAAAMQGTSQSLQVPPTAAQAIKHLESQLHDAGIEFDELGLSLVPGTGQSPVQLVTLVTKSPGGFVPLASFGRGSQQMAMVTLAAAQVLGSPIAVIDELEAGLEPYRQRALLETLRSMVAEGGQAFVTSHSTALLGHLQAGEAWKVRGRPERVVVPVHPDLDDLLRRDPEALLSRLPIICEGKTEVGVMGVFLRAEHGGDVSRLGIHLVDGTGQVPALKLIAALAEDAQLTCGIVDDESFASGRRAEIAAVLRVHLCVTPGGRCIECAVANAVPTDRLTDFLSVPGHNGESPDLTARLQAVSQQLGHQSRRSVSDLLAEFPEDDVRAAIGEAATGGRWFKSVEGGAELGKFILDAVPTDQPLVRNIRALVADALAFVGHPLSATRP